MPCFVVNLVTESRGINNGKRDSGALIIQFEFLVSQLAPW